MDKEYKLRYLPLFKDDLEKTVLYIADVLKNPQSVAKLIDEIEDAIRNRLKDAIDKYERIKSLADKVVYTSKAYHFGCMFKRNRHLVDHSSLCICYMTKQTDGTTYTVNYAKSKNIMTINLLESY